MVTDWEIMAFNDVLHKSTAAGGKGTALSHTASDSLTSNSHSQNLLCAAGKRQLAL